MRIFGVAALAVIAVASVGACGTDADKQSDPVSVTSAPSAKATSSSQPSTSTVVSPSPITSTAAPAPVPPAVTVVRCVLADGSAEMSDGSRGYVESCDESAGGPLPLQDGTSIYDAIPPLNLDEIPIADGGTCPAARCGYGHDANGNPNPSSGEIQTKYGCDEGYISDPALCDAVNTKYDW